MNKLTKEKRMQVVSALVEGSSINSTVRMTGVSKPTILKLLADLGEACAEYQNKTIRNLTCKRIQCDEIWSFCFEPVPQIAIRQQIEADNAARFERLHGHVDYLITGDKRHL